MGKAAARLSNRSVPVEPRFFYGWIIVVVSGLAIFFSGPGQAYSISVFVESYIHTLHLNRTAVSGIFALATLLSGSLLFAVGKMVDQWGERFMITFVSFMLGIACLWNSFAANLAMIFVGFFMIRYFGQGSMMILPGTLVSRWFIRRRGRALSLASLGGLIGGACFPPVINWLIEAYNWHIAWRLLGFALLLLFVPLSFYFVRNKPEDVGFVPDSSRVQADQPAAAEMSWTPSEAARTRSFWFLLIAMGLPGMAYSGLTFHFFSIMQEHHISRTTAAYMLSAVPIISFAFSLLSGIIVERVKVNNYIGIVYLANLTVPLILFFAHSELTVFLFGLAWGVAQGFIFGSLGVLLPNYYGREHIGSINSIKTTITVFGTAAGPLQFGYVYDHFGSYNLMLLLAGGYWLLGAILLFLSPAPIKKMKKAAHL